MEPLQKRQGNRLKEARIAAGFKSARAAALEFGWSESTYRSHENGTRPIKQNSAEKYTRKFRNLGSEITAKSVLYPDGKAEASDLDDYQKGWRDAVEHMAGMASEAAAPPKKLK